MRQQNRMGVRKKIQQRLGYALARRLPPCEEVAPVLSASLDRKLTLRERVVTRLHLLICAGCRRYFQQLLFLREAMHRHAHHFENGQAPDATALSPEARDRLKRALSDE